MSKTHVERQIWDRLLTLLSKTQELRRICGGHKELGSLELNFIEADKNLKDTIKKFDDIVQSGDFYSYRRNQK